MATDIQDKTVAELMSREQERCRAISECDWPALERLLRPDYTHTHASGMVQDKATYLTHVQGRPRATTRGELRVRVYDDAAIMAGHQTNQMDGSEAPVNAEIIQFWLKDGSQWLLAAFQSTRLKD